MALPIAEIVRCLLSHSPGEQLCDACLAFACSTSLMEMRKTTQALVAEEPSIHLGTTCANCRRKIAAVFFAQPIQKCAHCSRPLDDGEPAVMLEGDRFHDECLRRLLTDKTIGVSRRLSSTSKELIEQSRRRIRDGQARINTPPRRDPDTTCGSS